MSHQVQAQNKSRQVICKTHSCQILARHLKKSQVHTHQQAKANARGSFSLYPGIKSWALEKCGQYYDCSSILKCLYNIPKSTCTTDDTKYSHIQKYRDFISPPLPLLFSTLFTYLFFQHSLTSPSSRLSSSFSLLQVTIHHLWELGRVDGIVYTMIPYR